MTRQINPELVTWLDHKCAGPARHALITADARALFIHAMRAFVGIREQGGNNRGRLVELIQDTLGAAEGEPWCMSAVQSALAWAELRSGKISPIFASEHCLTVYRETPIIQRVKTLPLPGAIIIWQHGDSDSGHTGATNTLVVSDHFESLEGNTESGLSSAGIVREGGGFYLTNRSRFGSGKMKLLGFLKPF